MFFLAAGEKSRYEKHGVVGDMCPECGRVRAFLVADEFVAQHIYFAAVTEYRFEARTRLCIECGGVFRARLRDYDSFIPEDEAEDLTLREIVQRTNRRLADWIERRRRGPNAGNDDKGGNVEPDGRAEGDSNDPDWSPRR
jgi:hypothetical protein